MGDLLNGDISDNLRMGDLNRISGQLELEPDILYIPSTKACSCVCMSAVSRGKGVLMNSVRTEM